MSKQEWQLLLTVKSYEEAVVLWPLSEITI